MKSGIHHLTKTERQAIQRFTATVRQDLSSIVVAISLFGSRARGEGDENSDLDVLVLLNQVDTSLKNQIWDIANDIFLDTWINIAPLVVSESDFNRLLARERRVALEIQRDSLSI